MNGILAGISLLVCFIAVQGQLDPGHHHPIDPNHHHGGIASLLDQCHQHSDCDKNGVTGSGCCVVNLHSLFHSRMCSHRRLSGETCDAGEHFAETYSCGCMQGTTCMADPMTLPDGIAIETGSHIKGHCKASSGSMTMTTTAVP